MSTGERVEGRVSRGEGESGVRECRDHVREWVRTISASIFRWLCSSATAEESALDMSESIVLWEQKLGS